MATTNPTEEDDLVGFGTVPVKPRPYSLAQRREQLLGFDEKLERRRQHKSPTAQTADKATKREQEKSRSGKADKYAEFRRKTAVTEEPPVESAYEKEWRQFSEANAAERKEREEDAKRAEEAGLATAAQVPQIPQMPSWMQGFQAPAGNLRPGMAKPEPAAFAARESVPAAAEFVPIATVPVSAEDRAKAEEESIRAADAIRVEQEKAAKAERMLAMQSEALKMQQEREAKMKAEQEQLEQTQASLQEAYALIVQKTVRKKKPSFVFKPKPKPVYAFAPWKNMYTTSIISELESRLKETYTWKKSLKPVATIDITDLCKLATAVSSSVANPKHSMYVSLLHSDGSYTDTGAIAFPSPSSVSFYRNTYADPDNRSRAYMKPVEDSDDFWFFYDPAFVIIRDLRKAGVEEVELQNGPILEFLAAVIGNVVTVETYHPSGSDKEVHITISLSTTGNILRKKADRNVFTQEEVLSVLRLIEGSRARGVAATTLQGYEFLQQVQNRVVTVLTVGTPAWDARQTLTAAAISCLTATTCDNIQYHDLKPINAMMVRQPGPMIVRQPGTVNHLDYSERDKNDVYIASACHFVPPEKYLISAKPAESLKQAAAALGAGAAEISEEATAAFEESLKATEMKLNELDAMLLTLERKAQGAAAAASAPEVVQEAVAASAPEVVQETAAASAPEAVLPYDRKLPHAKDWVAPPDVPASVQLAYEKLNPPCDVTPEEFAANLAIAMDLTVYKERTEESIRKERVLADAVQKIIDLYSLSNMDLAAANKKSPYKAFTSTRPWLAYIDTFRKNCSGAIASHKLQELETIVKEVAVSLPPPKK